MPALRRSDYAPVYFLCGEEPYFIDVVADYIENNVLDEMAREFDLTIIYGRDLQGADVAPVVSAARRFPMMGQKQVIIVREAQNIKKWEALGFYMEKPMSTTILVFCYKYGKPDGRLNVFKNIEKKGGVMMESPKMRDYQVQKWIPEYVKQYADSHHIRLSITPMAVMLISDSLGEDLEKIVSDINKLIIAMPQGVTEITPEIVERNIGISKDYNIFELEKAIINNDVVKANRIVYYFADSKDHPIQKELVVLFSFFQNLLLYHYLPDKDSFVVSAKLGINPHFAKDYALAAKRYTASKTLRIIGYIRQTDARSKGIDNPSADEKALWQELIYKILH